MLGFLIGTACLIGLFVTVKRGRYAHAFGGYGMGHGCHDGHHGRHHGGWRGERGFGGGRGSRDHDGGGPFAMLRRAFRILDTTPGQEKVLREAMDSLWGRGREAKASVTEARKGFAKAIREESFDEVALGEATAKLEEATDAMRKAVIDALAKAHGVLDERQRRVLADFIESGPRFSDRFGGPYRGGHDGRGSGRDAWEV